MVRFIINLSLFCASSRTVTYVYFFVVYPSLYSVSVLPLAAAAKSLQSCLTLRPHRQQPTRLPSPWDSPGKNAGVGFHFLLQCMKVKRESKVAQSCPTLSDPTDCSQPGSSVHGIFQARVLEWGAIAFSDPHIDCLTLEKCLCVCKWGSIFWKHFIWGEKWATFYPHQNTSP